jgi:hypothetical protein
MGLIIVRPDEAAAPQFCRPLEFDKETCAPPWRRGAGLFQLLARVRM